MKVYESLLKQMIKMLLKQMIKMFLKIQDLFTRPNKFLPDMSDSQMSFVKVVSYQSKLKFSYND